MEILDRKPLSAESSHTVQDIKKRDGSVMKFEADRIAKAVYKAMQSVNEGSPEAAMLIAHKVEEELLKIRKRFQDFMPNVEGVQDLVEKTLILESWVETAKAYIVYRRERAKKRSSHVQVPEHVQRLAEESKQYFRNPLSEFVYLRTYARWIPEEGRRETWVETVDRYVSFMREHIGNKLTESEYQELRMAILRQEVMPSMRLLQFAGNAARKTSVCAYNCSFIAPKTLRDFAEVMYLSMCGTGVGFSVESQNIQSLPQIQLQLGQMKPTHTVEDSKEGWCDALYLGLETWFSGADIQFDYARLRPAGARLNTMGGKSSGPGPLKDLLNFAREKVLSRQGRRLSNLDAHDILCKIGEVVVSGGVRRSAMISLSDLDDGAMRDAKRGQFYYNEPQRCMANNSAVYDLKPSNEVLLDEWLSLAKSGSGERGIFNRGSLPKTLPKRRVDLLKNKGLISKDDRMMGILGTNPCAEIILQSKQFCNLSEVVARAEDTEADLQRKVRLATLLGTYQSTLTNFPYLSAEWRENCEAERLLGVSVTGQWDCELSRQGPVLERLKESAVRANAEYAKRFGVNASSCITCVKPSGTVSQTVDCASGMHPRHSAYYIRRIRISATDSLFRMLKEQGVPYNPEVGQAENSATTFVFDFPVAAPKGAVVRDDLSAIQQLEHWKTVKVHYTEHNPSVTVSVGEDEWIEVLNWVNQNWEIVGGLSFLPRVKHIYRLAPYESIDEAQYHELLTKFKNVDFSQLMRYEAEDETESKRELACAGGVCEL